MKKLSGVITALPTSLDSEGRVILEVMGRHVEDSIDAGVAGFWVGGATGCAIYLDIEQRKQVLKETVAVIAGRVPVLAMVSAMSLRDGIVLAEYAGELGVAGVSALPPLFYKPALTGVINYLSALQKAAGLPMTYYHLPGLTHVSLDASELIQLCEQVPLEAIKFSDNDLWTAIEVLQHCPEISILVGAEELLLGGMALGCAHGTVGGGQNFMPGPMVDIYDAMKRGDLARAQGLQVGVARVAAVQGMFDFTASTYGILKLLGYDYGNPIAPMPSLDGAQVDQLNDALIKAVGPEPLIEGRLIESQDLVACTPDQSERVLPHPPISPPKSVQLGSSHTQKSGERSL